MSTDELRAELRRTNASWRDHLAGVAATPAHSSAPPHPSAMSNEARRHLEVLQELFRRGAGR